MKRPLSICLALLFGTILLLVTGARPASADGFIIPQPPVDRPIRWREVPLAVKYHHVEVIISDQVATTRVDQVFANHASYPVEGTYLFPLPEDAAISSFDMWVDGKKLEGKLLNRDEARAIYEEIVRSQRDPALLEYAGRDAFQARIFPIPPGGERRIELTYNQVLPQADGLVHYRYPLNTEKFSALPLADVAVTVHVKEKTPLGAIYSPSHPITVEREGRGRATVGYEARNVRPDRDFDLYYSKSESSTDGISANLLTYKPSDEDGFFLLLVTPPSQVESGVQVAKDVILVMDTSGSMEGAKMTQAKAAADYVLDHLAPSDRFNIVSFSSATRLLADEPVGASRAGEGHDFIRRLRAEGSTDINRALLKALAGAGEARPTVLIFLTDGLPTMGETEPDRIVANVAKNAPHAVRLFAFGVGDDVDTFLLDQLSSGQRGASAYVRPEEKIDEVVSGFYAKVSSPVLVDVKLAFSGVHVDGMVPTALPDLFAGTQLVLVGRYRDGGPAPLQISGQVNGQGRSYTYADLSFVRRGGNEFIPTLWAQRKIGYLLSQIRLNGASDELVKEVIALSTRYGIVTPYTSFLVQEPQLALTQAGRDRLGETLMAPGGPHDGAGPSPAAPMLAPEARSGAQAVERAQAEKALAASDQSAVPANEQVRQVGDKAFVLHDGTWLDTLFDANTMQAEPISFGSDRYFQVIAENPELGRYLALGDRVIVVLAGRAFGVGPTGQADAAPAQNLTATQAPVPTMAPAESATSATQPSTHQPQATPVAPSSTAAPRLTPDRPAREATVASAPTAYPAGARQAGSKAPAQIPCPPAGAIGLVAVGLPLWMRRRR